MTNLLTPRQMRATETAAIASGAVTGSELMERAGQGVVAAIFAEWPELAAGSFRAVVLCGPGNNGGDGFVVARLLKEWGWEVEVYLYGATETLPPDAQANYARWLGLGPVADYRDFDAPRGGFQIVVDALFGIGMTRPMEFAAQHEEILAVCFAKVSDRPPYMVAVDVPTGLNADTGSSMEPHFHAALTVTFHAPKVGHYLGVGPSNCGKLRVVDIGLPASSFDTIPLVEVRQNASYQPLAKRLLPPGQQSGLAHKFSHGHALILSGASGQGGAARLAARGALRIGAGLVTIGCPLEALPENAARLDAVMLHEVSDGAALAAVLEDRRINAVCIGPGLGVTRAAEMLGVVLAGGPGAAVRRVVIDADGLTALAQDAGLRRRLHADCVLTPHGGEFARLFPDIATKLEDRATTGPAFSKVDATREAAARSGCVVLYKGADTVISAPDGRCSVNSAHYDRQAPWLATAGSGDVLAGFIAGLLARGFGAMQAAETGAWLHVECAQAFGPGLIAEDLAEQLPGVFRSLGV